MHESEGELRELQAVLDRSYASAGSHLLGIFTPDLRIPASELAGILEGMQLLNLATVTAKGEPRVGPVDGLFFKGRFWFGSSPTSRRFVHIRSRPQVSATHTRGEDLAVVVHGRAAIVDLWAPEQEGFRGYCREVYGDVWTEWRDQDDAIYARIEPAQMFASRLPH